MKIRRYLESKRHHAYPIAAAILSTFVLMGCHLDMWNQPKFAALQENDFFANSSAARTPVPGTIPYVNIRRNWSAPVFEILTDQEVVPTKLDTAFWVGLRDDTLMADNYFTVTKKLLDRGRERFDISCSPCHGLVGDANGVITLRGFPNPTSYHLDRLREVEDGYIFDVITSGFGRMYSHASRVTPEDRWAIVAYIRALQYSQNADPDDLSDADRVELRASSQTQEDEHVAVTNAH